MNIVQKIILIIGALMILAIAYNTKINSVHPISDIGKIMFRMIGVATVTGVAFIVTKSNVKQKPKESKVDE